MRVSFPYPLSAPADPVAAALWSPGGAIAIAVLACMTVLLLLTMLLHARWEGRAPRSTLGRWVVAGVLGPVMTVVTAVLLLRTHDVAARDAAALRAALADSSLTLEVQRFRDREPEVRWVRRVTTPPQSVALFGRRVDHVPATTTDSLAFALPLSRALAASQAMTRSRLADDAALALRFDRTPWPRQ